MTTAPVDLSPLWQLAGLGALLACAPLLWWHLRSRSATPQERLRALTLLTLFLTFDLVLFGAFTRLTDSGLGCPDWPGCYGSASPLGAREEIHAAQSALPSGPVTHGKAWIEMIHRYLASSVGFLILVLCVQSWRQWWRQRRQAEGVSVSPGWASLTLVWVCMQGAFGKLTVTMKLFPAIVTLHLLGGLGLLVLLAWQAQGYRPQPMVVSRGLRWAGWGLLLLSVMQVSLGGWVSTNYAVLACSEFPTCQAGQWWPSMDFAHGFTLWRELGVGADGGWLPFEALTAIHMSHRLGALVVFTALLLFVWRLRASPDAGHWPRRLSLVAAWQLISGMSNVVLDWPIVAALAHTGGAAMLLLLLGSMLAQMQQGRGLPQRSAAVASKQTALDSRISIP
ncbi:COX15/CtaA family protein [Paucibacter sp. DJ1R-11]|uniref:COX15/CtaA family protein n=1 Tax=Paucibacter sp. DJ1R-11 TaxID=2893556 RepID=UPI0021E439BA|nr:COX15/CtaA family protein [Paucibacter sp. DJ1R-11]MCV2364638.1 COX15/CtaA family protein [Paucibacter sp. DJ1R-11]